MLGAGIADSIGPRHTTSSTSPAHPTAGTWPLSLARYLAARGFETWLAGPILSYGRSSQLESSFRSCNVDPVVPARYFRNGIPDEATDLAEQFKSWITEGCMRNRTGSVVYSDRLGSADKTFVQAT